MRYLIYKITNLKNKKFYIGAHKTNNINDGYMGSGKAIHAAYKKYGIDNFYKEIIAECSDEGEMYALERELVVPAYKDKNSYNLMEGGVGGFNYINETGQNGSKKLSVLMTDPAWASYWKERQLLGYLKYLEDVPKEELSKRGVQANKTAKARNGSYPFEGLKHSEYTKQCIGLKNSKNTGEKSSQFGSMWITNSIDSRKIMKNDPIPEGWYKGRKMK